MPHAGLELNLEDFFKGLRATSVEQFKQERAQSRVGVARRLAELDRLTDPSREIILRETERREDVALANLLSGLAGQEFTARQNLAQLALQERQLSLQEEEMRRAIEFQEKEAQKERRRRKRGGLGRAIGGVAGTTLGFIAGGPFGAALGAPIGAQAGEQLSEAFGGL